jgi:glucose/arabinose dehydrogenase
VNTHRDPQAFVVPRQLQEVRGPHHIGGALHFGPDGMIYWTAGNNAQATTSQDLRSTHGKMHRLNDDGTVPGTCLHWHD